MTNQATINEVVNELTADIVNRTRKMVLNEVIDVLEERRDTVVRILLNGRVYFEQAIGERFDRLCDSRDKLWYKIRMYHDMIELISKMR